MKKMFIKSVLSASFLFLILFSVVASAPGVPLGWGHSEVENWNFETWSSGTSNVAPDNWVMDGTAHSSFGRSSDSKVSDYSYFITANGGSATSILYQNIEVTPGYYTIGTWIKIEDSTSGVLNIDFYSDVIDTGGIMRNGDSDWVYQESTTYVDYTGTLKVRIFANDNPNNGAKFFVDGLVVKKDTSIDSYDVTVYIDDENMNVSIWYTPDAVYSNSILHVDLAKDTYYYDDYNKLGSPTATVTPEGGSETPIDAWRATGNEFSAKTFAYIDTSNFATTGNLIWLTIPINQPPDLYYPENEIVIESDYPEYNEISFSWEDTAARYNGVISTEPDFSTEWYNSTLYENEWNVYLGPGTYYWKISAYDSKNEKYSEPSVRTFSIGDVPSKPGYAKIYVKNESTGANLTSFSVDLYNENTYITKSTTTGSIEYSSSEVVEGEYTAKIYASGYSPKWRIIESPETITAYLIAEDTASLINFNLIDYTNLFKYRETKLLITRPADSGTLTISENYFDAAGLNKVYLENNVNYDLVLQTGALERSVGPYVATQTDVVSLVVGDVELIPPSTVYGGFNYSLQKTNESVIMRWTAPAGSLYGPFSYNVTDTYSGEIVYSITSIAPRGIATFIYPDPEKQYYVQLWANTSGGELLHQEYCRSESQMIDLQVSDYWYNVISFFIIATFGLLFGYRSSKMGAMLTSILTLGLYVAGFLRISEAVAALIVVLGLLTLLGGRKQ